MTTSTRELLRAAIDRENEDDMVNELTRIFNLIVESGEAPEEWCRAVVKPLFKDGDREDWTNYRLISLISVVGKLFETVLPHRTERALSEEGLLTEFQCGFRPEHCCGHAQFILSETMKARAARTLDTHVALLDARKAYPATYRSAIMSKLGASINKLPASRKCMTT